MNSWTSLICSSKGITFIYIPCLFMLLGSLDHWLIAGQFSMYFFYQSICMYFNTWNEVSFVLGSRGFKLKLKVHTKEFRLNKNWRVSQTCLAKSVFENLLEEQICLTLYKVSSKNAWTWEKLVTNFSAVLALCPSI